MYYIFLIILVFAFCLIGYTIYKILNIKIENQFQLLFFYLTTSSFLSTIIYSICKTSFVTINIITIPIILILVFLVKFKKPRFNFRNFKIIKKPLLGLLSIVTLIFIWKYYYVFGSGNEFPLIIGLDDHCHTSRAMFFNSHGIETTNLNYLNPPDGIEPFHYFEAWFIGFFQWIFGANYWLTLQLIVYPFLNGIIILGTWSIINRYTTKKLHFLISSLIIIISGFFLEEITTNSFFRFSHAFGSNSIDEFWGLKFSIVYIIIVGFINLCLNKKYLISIILLLLLPIFSITLAPSIFTGISLIIIINYLSKNKFVGPEIKLFHLSIPIIICVFILSFYKIFEPSLIQIKMPTGINEILNEFNTFFKIKSKLIISIEKIIHLILFYLPFIILFYLNQKRIRKLQHKNKFKFINQTFNFLFLISGISIIFYPLFHFIFASAEFFFYPTLPIFNIISLITIIFSLILFKNTKSYYYILGFIMLISSFFIVKTSIIHYDKIVDTFGTKRYSENYLKEVEQEFSKIKNKIGAKIEHENELWASDAVDVIGAYIIGLTDDPYSLVSLSRTSETKYPDEHHKTLGLSSEYYQYTEFKKNNNTFESYEKTQVDFINKHEIKYIIISNQMEIPKEILKLSKKVIIDKNTGEKFISLQE